MELYTDYANDVKRFLICMTGEPDLAEDLTQETFYQAYKSIHRYNGGCKLSVWLCQIARHVYYDYLKKQKHLKTVSMDEISELSSEESPEKNYLLQEAANTLLEIAGNVKDPYGKVFLLRIYGELNYKEIGNIFEKSENWARVTYYRAKEMIKERAMKHEYNL